MRNWLTKLCQNTFDPANYAEPDDGLLHEFEFYYGKEHQYLVHAEKAGPDIEIRKVEISETKSDVTNDAFENEPLIQDMRRAAADWWEREAQFYRG